MKTSQTNVTDDRGSDDEMTQLCVRTTRSSLRTFKRLADRRSTTLTQWVLDLCWEGVTRDLDELRKSIEDAEVKAQRELEAEKEQLTALERDTALRMKKDQASTTTRKTKVRQSTST